MAESHREEIAKLEALYASSPGGRVFVHLAEALRKAGDYERARGILSEGLGRHSDSASGYVVLGRLLTDLQADAEAEEAFRRVLQLDGGNLIALRGLADLALRGGRRQEAAGYYTDLLARNPAGDDVRHLLAELELGDTVALENVEEAAQAGTLPAVAEPSADWERDWADAGAGDHPDEAVAPFSAAPGDTGEVEAAEPEFGFIEVDSAAVTEEADTFGAGLHGDTDWIIDARDADLSELLGEEAAGTTAEFDLSELSLTSFDAPDDDPPQPAWEELTGISADTGMAADSLDAAQFEVIDAAAGLPEDPEAGEDVEVGLGTEPTWRDEGSESFASGDLDDAAAPDPHSGHTGDDLVTETMADLYSSQGFHDRAADVYRALLRQRPADAALTAKLQAAEAAQRVDRASAGADVAQSEVADDGSDGWLQGLGAWTATPEDLPDETPYAWTRGADEDGEPEPATHAAPAIGAYLRELLSWTPGEGRVGAGDDAPVTTDSEAGPGEAGSGAEFGDTEQQGFTGRAPDPDDVEEAVEPPSHESSEPGDPWAHSPAEIAEPAADSAAAAEYEPWAFTTGDDPAEGDQDASVDGVSTTSEPDVSASDSWRNVSRPVDAVEAAFNEWYLGDDAAPADVPREAAAETASPTPPPAAEEPRPPQAGPRLGVGSADEDGDEDEDEDLAMFRAWLQSLKK